MSIRELTNEELSLVLMGRRIETPWGGLCLVRLDENGVIGSWGFHREPVVYRDTAGAQQMLRGLSDKNPDTCWGFGIFQGSEGWEWRPPRGDRFHPTPLEKYMRCERRVSGCPRGLSRRNR